MQHMTPEERRRGRLKELAGWCKANDGANALGRMLGRGALLWGAKAETVREYLRDLELAGLIEVLDKEDEIAWVGGE